jgi:hypothetical protein
MKYLLPCLVAALLPLAACQNMPPSADWVEREFTAPSENVMWEVVRRSMSRMEFPQGAGMDRARLQARSGWLSRPSPFKDKGSRKRAIVEIDPQGEGLFGVRARVQKQRNEALVNPADLRYAEWKWEKDDVEAARILVQHMRTFLDSELVIEP